MTTDRDCPLAYFDRVFIINLTSRADRRREMDRQLKKIGLSLRHPLIEIFAAIRPADKGPFESIGARGAFLSHLGVLTSAARRRYERILILEDDVNFFPGFNARFARVVADLGGAEWHLFYGGYAFPDGTTPSAEITCVDAEVGIMLAHFIAFRAPAIAVAADFLATLLTRPAGDPNGGPMHVDGAYSWLRRLHPSFVTRLAVPPIAYQRASRTDIHDLPWFDRLAGLREIAAVARSLKNLTRRT